MRLEAHWSQISPKPDPIYGSPLARSSHGTSVIRSDDSVRIYIYGGEHDPRVPISAIQSTWCAEPDPASFDARGCGWRWRCILPSRSNHQDDLGRQADTDAHFPSVRVAHSQCTVGDSKIYVFGGRCGKTMGESSLDDLWVLDCTIPGKEAWMRVACKGTAPEPRSYHQMVATADCLFVFGGCGANGRLTDLHRFNIAKATWTTLSSPTVEPSCLAGRGGAALLLLDGNKLAAVTGFVGHETHDGQVFDINSCTWESNQVITFHEMQPRSVSSFVSGLYLEHAGQFAVIFGGEVESSKMGHAGAGAFQNDLLILHGSSGSIIQSIFPQESVPWPMERGWASATAVQGSAEFYLFGGLSGDDQNPVRLDDLWHCIFK